MAIVKKVVRPAVHLWYRKTAACRMRLRAKANSVAFELARLDPGSLRRSVESGQPIGRSPSAERTIVMLVISTVEADPRVEREARSLAAAGWRIVVLFPETRGWRDAGISWGDKVIFDPISPRAGVFADVGAGFYGEKLYRAAIRHRPFAFHAHDLNTAYVGLGAARKTGAFLVCDFHEWFSENVSYDLRTQTYRTHVPRVKAAMQHLERQVLAEASAVVTVCSSIAEALAVELGNGRPVSVVRNMPSFAAEPTKQYLPLKQQIGVPHERFVLLYQGGIGPSRNIEPIISALVIAQRCTLVVRGPAIRGYEDYYRQFAERAGVADRLFLLPPVPSRDVVAAARGANAGIYTVKGIGRNFILALPNKVFEYMMAGLPLLVPDYPEVAKLVHDHDVGLIFNPENPISIAAAINRLIDEHELVQRFQANVPRALRVLDADREWQKIVAIYDQLIADCAASNSRQ